jgi:hypothetical protein
MLTAPGLCWLCRMPLAVAHWGVFLLHSGGSCPCPFVQPVVCLPRADTCLAADACKNRRRGNVWWRSAITHCH